MTRIYQAPPVQADCRECGKAFEYDVEYYCQNDLTPPHSCKPCIAARKARSIEVRAVVTRAADTFVFARGDDGIAYYISPAGLSAKVGKLQENDLVILSLDPKVQTPPGRKPGALRVRRA